MRTMRGVMLVLLFVAAVGAAWWFVGHRSAPVADAIAVYYIKEDGVTLVPWRVSLGPARDRVSVALYAATQCVAGPPTGTAAVRFPNGTHVGRVDVSGTSVTIDLGYPAGTPSEGSFGEAAFKALVWTLTQPSLGIDAVNVRINGARVATLPGSNLELDDALSRSSF